MSAKIEEYGWTAQPRDPALFLRERPSSNEPVPQPVSSIPLSSSPLVDAVMSYAQQELNTQTFNHSMRVYYYGIYYLSSPSVSILVGPAMHG